MDDFRLYLANLPKPLDKKEQEILLYEYCKTRDSKIRDKLIVHNQRMCADFAISYCKKNNILNQLEDIYSECVIALVEAIDAYDMSTGLSLGNIAYKYFDTQLLNNYLRTSRDATNHIIDKEFLDKDDDEIDMGELKFFIDETASSFRDNVSGVKFVKDILDYIDSMDEKMSIVMKMSCGLGGYTVYTQQQIANKLNFSRSYIGRIFLNGQKLIKTFIAENYPETYPDIAKEVNQKPTKQFDSLEERDEYIWKAYYGIGCEQKSVGDIAKEVGLSAQTVSNIVANRRKTTNEEEKEQLANNNSQPLKSNKQWSEELKQTVFDMFYGLNGYDIHTAAEISKLLADHNKKVSAISSKLFLLKEQYVREGKYTAEQIEEFQKERELKVKETQLKDREKYAYEYYSYYGLNGYEKKSLIQLSKELKIAHQNVSVHIKKYEEYLASIRDGEKSPKS